VGEWATASFGVGRGNDIEILKEIHWPDSLGLLYSAFTYYTGFKVNSGEYKVMGLAPYGEPKFVDLIYRELMDLKEDGSFTLNQRYFNYLNGLTMTNGAFDRLFGGPPREPESKLTQREMDLARSVQEVCEEVMLRMARTVHRETGVDRLCLAGGVALNCVGNGRLLREGPFKELWIQPAAGDAGGALGVAQLAWHRHRGQPRRITPGKDSMKGAYLGPAYTEGEIEAYLRSLGASYRRLERAELLHTAARLLAEEKVVGWFNGRMEFGPRALGARSILGDPRSSRMQAQMNLKIKFREGFRPFAPSVLRERVNDYFELDVDSPYMLLVAPVRKDRQIPMDEAADRLWGIDKLNVVRSDIPAVTHNDYSARIHSVSRETNPDYYDLIREFECLTGCPVLVNTSFNVRGEPIVCSPADAYRCFMRTHLDYLALGPFFLDKVGQPEWEESGNWREEFQLD
jgi:carbamoyltransferase